MFKKRYFFVFLTLITTTLFAMEQDDQFVSKKRKGQTLESESKQPKTVPSQPKSGKNALTSLFDFYKNNAKNMTPQTILTPKIVHKTRTPECFYPELYKMLPQQDNAGRSIRYHSIVHKNKPLLGSSTELFEVGAIGSDAACVLQLDKATKALKTKKQQQVYFNDIVSSNKKSKFITAQRRLFDAIENNDLPEVKRLCTPVVDSTGRVKRRIDLEQTFPDIKRDNDIFPKPMEGQTPLTFAINKNQVIWGDEEQDQIIKYFVEDCKVNVNTPSVFGESPLYWASNTYDQSNIDYLVNHGADINVKDNEGNSLLHDEINRTDKHRKENAMNWFVYFLQKNIDIRSTNKQGQTAWLVAAEQGKQNIIQFITNYVIKQMKNNKQEEARLCIFCRSDMKDVEALAVTDYGCLTIICKTCKDTLKQNNPKCPKCRRDMH